MLGLSFLFVEGAYLETAPLLAQSPTVAVLWRGVRGALFPTSGTSPRSSLLLHSRQHGGPWSRAAPEQLQPRCALRQLPPGLCALAPTTFAMRWNLQSFLSLLCQPMGGCCEPGTVVSLGRAAAGSGILTFAHLRFSFARCKKVVRGRSSVPGALSSSRDWLWGQQRKPDLILQEDKGQLVVVAQACNPDSGHLGG